MFNFDKGFCFARESVCVHTSLEVTFSKSFCIMISLRRVLISRSVLSRSVGLTAHSTQSYTGTVKPLHLHKLILTKAKQEANKKTHIC